MREYGIRVFKRKRAWFLIGAMVLINVLHFYRVPDYDIDLSYVPLLSAWNKNMLYLGKSTLSGLVYYFLLYLLAAIPMSDALVEDQDTGLIDQVFIRKTRGAYVRSTYLANFLFGGLFCALPLLIHLLLAFVVYPILPVNQINVNFQNSFFMGQLILSHPFVFYLLRCLFVFFIGGGIAGLALFINTLSHNKYVGLFAVFVLDCLVQLACSFFTSMTNIPLSIGVLGNLASELTFPAHVPTFVYMALAYAIPILYFAFIYMKEGKNDKK